MVTKSVAWILVVVIIIDGTGCYSYNQIQKVDTEKLEVYDKVKITTFDEKEYILRDVVIEGSILSGFKKKGDRHINKYYRTYGLETEIEDVQIPIQQIKKIEVQESNTNLTSTVVRTIGITLGVILGITLIVYLLVPMPYIN